MKKLLIAVVAGVLPSMVLLTDAFAQNENIAKASSPKIMTNTFEGLTDPTAVELTKGDAKGDLAGINEKAIKNFSKAYKFVSNESWSAIKDGFAADFSNAGVKTTIFYNRKGRWTGSIKGYGEELLAKRIKEIINSNFDGYTINYVQEVETVDSYSTPTYLVHIQSATKIKQVRIFNDTFDVYKEYNKVSIKN